MSLRIETRPLEAVAVFKGERPGSDSDGVKRIRFSLDLIGVKQAATSKANSWHETPPHDPDEAYREAALEAVPAEVKDRLDEVGSLTIVGEQLEAAFVREDVSRFAAILRTLPSGDRLFIQTFDKQTNTHNPIS